MSFAKSGLILGGAMAFALTIAAPAAALVRVSGSGLWNEGGQASDVSTPGQAWSFSFLLPDSVSNPTTAATQFVYSLAGSPTELMLGSVEFFPVDQSGFFDMTFVFGGRTGKFNILAANPNDPSGVLDLGSDGRLVLGTFAIQIADVHVDRSIPIGLGAVTLESVGANAIPEPGAWALMILGFGLAGTALRRRTPPAWA
jgi:hypothetical protein